MSYVEYKRILEECKNYNDYNGFGSEEILLAMRIRRIVLDEQFKSYRAG